MESVEPIDAIDMLVDGAVQQTVMESRKNPYIMMETVILRLCKKITDRYGVELNIFEKNNLFSQWHEEIFKKYQSLKSNMSHDEKINVERALSKDCPHSVELTKFATAWYKYDAVSVCKWFAVDGFLGPHPKAYVNDAFSANFEQHNSAVRMLYNHFTDPEKIKEIVEKAFAINEEDAQLCDLGLENDFASCVGYYAEIVGNEEMKRVASERRAKLQAQQQPKQRKRKNPSIPPSTTPQPISPPDSPEINPKQQKLDHQT